LGFGVWSLGFGVLGFGCSLRRQHTCFLQRFDEAFDAGYTGQGVGLKFGVWGRGVHVDRLAMRVVCDFGCRVMV